MEILRKSESGIIEIAYPFDLILLHFQIVTNEIVINFQHLRIVFIASSLKAINEKYSYV